MAQSLPPSPSLEHLKKQAKSLLKALRAHDAAALARARKHFPDAPGAPTLALAQIVIAREHGFPSWPRLRTYIDSLVGPRAGRRRPFSTDVDYFSERASGLVRSHQDAIDTTLAQIREFHPRFAGISNEEIQKASFTQDDARLAVAREHGFVSWRQFVRYLRDLESGKTAEPFFRVFRAIESNDTALLKEILDRDSTLATAPGTNGNTLLNLAVSCRKPDCVQLLLDAGADVNAANKYGWTPLHQAAYTNQAEIVRLFMDHGGSLSLSARGDGGTPLVQALFWGHRDLADEMALRGIFPCNLRVAAGLGRLDLIEGFFDEHGKLTPEAGLHREFYRPHPGFPTCTPTNDPQEILDDALVYASKNGRADVLSFLVEHGANVNGAPCKANALNSAASNGHLEVMEWLLAHGADVNGNARTGDSTGRTPLHDAAMAGCLAGARCLVEHGADTTIRAIGSQATPLGWADHFDHYEVRDYLLAHGTLDLADAIDFGRVERIAELLEAEPAAVNRPLYDTSRASRHAVERVLPLARAIVNSQAAVVQLLLERGADPDAPVAAGQSSPLNAAMDAGNEEILGLLRQYGAQDSG